MPEKLSVEEHRIVGMHFHAIDHHINKLCRLLGAGTGHTRVPRELFDRLVEIKRILGAGSSFSEHTLGSIADSFESLMLAEHPGSSLEVYNGDYADCVTSRMLDRNTPV